MQDQQLSKEDVEWLLIRHPELDVNGDVIKGTLRFSGYEIKSEQFSDSYEVEIYVPDITLFPIVIETGGKIEKTPDRHINGDGTMCICGPVGKLSYRQNEPSIEKFFTQFLVPYFASQSYYEKYREWPFGELAHGVLGVLEDLGEHWPKKFTKEFLTFALESTSVNCLSFERSELGDIILKNSKIRKHRNCLCGSEEPFYMCHPEAFEALMKMRKSWQKVLLKSEAESFFQ